MLESDIIGESNPFSDNGIEDVRLLGLGDIIEGSKRMDVKYGGEAKIYLYAPCSASDFERIKTDKSILSAFNFYESRNTAEAFTSGVQRLDHILEVVLDTSGCLDLLNLCDLRQIKLFYEAGIKSKSFQKGIDEKELLMQYIRSQNNRIKSTRYIRNISNKLYIKLKLTIGSYIVYKVIDIGVLSGIKLVK